MSAEEQAVDAGPTIFTVEGQEGHVSTVAPVEVQAEVKENTTEVETKVDEVVTTAGSEEQVEEENRDEKGRFKPSAKDRIDQLTRARRDAERDAEYWKGVATGKITPPAQEAPAAAAKPSEAPVRDQFENDEAYIEALTDHKLEAKLAEREQKAQQTKELTTVAETWQSKLAAARADIPDFDSVMDNAEIQVANHVASLIMKHGQGAKVAHHFASNPAELEKVNAMDAADAAFAIAEIAGQFKPQSTTSSSKPAVVAKKVSEAPPPAARNVGAGRSTTVALGDMSMDDYVAARKAQGASWAR